MASCRQPRVSRPAIEPVSNPSYSNYFVEKTRRMLRGAALDWEHEIRLIRELVHRYRQGSQVVDLGCGVGTVLFALASDGLECSGVDFDPLQIEAARAFGRELGVDGITFLAARTEEVPFAADSFDIVVSRDVAEHLPDADLDAYLAQARRLLRPGGVLVLHTKPTKYAYLHEREYVWLLLPAACLGPRVLRVWLRLLDRVVPRVYRAITGRPMADTWQQSPPGHCNCPDKDTLLRAIAGAGFCIEATQLFVPANRRYLRLLERIMPFETTKSNILVAARKL